MNCKPGDLAISVHTEQAMNRGIIVEVIRRHIDTPEWNYYGRPAWWCKSSQTMGWYFAKRDEWRYAKEGPIPDDALQPIRPGRAPDADGQPADLERRETCLA